MTMPMIGCGASQTTCPRLGDKAPDFTFIGLDGGKVSLSDYAGKPVIINTWNLSCIECKHEMPYFQSINAKYQDKGLVILSVNTLDGIGTSTKEYISKSGFTFTVLYDKNQDVYKKFCCAKCDDPYTFFISSDGSITSIKIGGFKSEEEILTEVKKILPGL
jgi:peroxiredoxin